jgi:hypothetical protein
MDKNISTTIKKITLLNDITLESMMEKDKISIIRNFTETGIKILEADFGFAWWKFKDTEDYTLAYKSTSTPYEPTIPREKAGNYIARITKKPFFDSDVNSGNYEFDINRYLKSYIIIPINYGDNVYGSLVLCYKDKHSFSDEELALAEALGNTTAQAITIYRLGESERKALISEAKQKETELLLTEEKSKTEFIANSTHEFRTPLAIIRGHVDLALHAKTAELKTAKEALKVIEGETIHLSEMLADLVTLTSEKKVNKENIDYTLVDLSLILRQIASRLKPVAEEKKISIEIKKKYPCYIGRWRRKIYKKIICKFD